MELRHLRHFVAVAEELHFARAAERLGLEQSPLSHSIRNLEAELKASLFHRTTRKTWLTRAGTRFYAEAKRIPAFGLVHGVDKGAKRLIDGLNDDTLRSGVFYASDADALTGPVIDQSVIVPDLANPTYQDNARDAVHRFA